MTTTIAPEAPPFDLGVACAPVDEVLRQDTSGTLAFVVARRRQADALAAEEMRAVTHFADLHRVGADDYLYGGAVDPEVREALRQQDADAAQVVVGLQRPAEGREGRLRLAGQGTFMVEEFAVTELAAGLAMTEAAARGYVGQSLELRDRLPRLWGAVMAGQLPAWKARLVAKETIPLNPEAAAYVDAHLGAFAHKVTPGRILRAVEAAILRNDPELAEARAMRAAEGRGVWLEHELDGTTSIRASAATPDAMVFDAALDTVATGLRRLGDRDIRDVRRAKALGVLADPQYALDLLSTAASAGEPPLRGLTPVETTSAAGPPSMHVHLHMDAVTGLTPVVRVAGIGPRSLAAVEEWLTDLAPGAAVTVTPVVNLADTIVVDAYEAPDRLRRQVTERDQCCQFPWCGRRGRHDLDHIVEYVPPDEGGPPGQTRSDNLALLCRFHHRVKTHTDWRYQRDPDGSLTWTSPVRRRYRVDGTGTAAI